MVKKSGDKSKSKFPSLRSLILISWPFVVASMILLFTRLAIRNPELADAYYSEGVYPYIEKFLSSISSLISFSLWDSMWIVVILLVIIGLILVILRRIKPGWFFLRLAQLVAILYSLFYIAWGFNYFRSELEIREGWEKPKANELVFRSVLDTLITRTNSSYVSITRSDYSEIDSLIGLSYRENGKILGINYSAGIIRPKTMIFSSFFAKTGVNGYFGPFFNEIHLNNYIFSPEYPFALAHEKAHQLGIASEAEANFAAFAINTGSDDRRLQYSGYLYMLIYFLSDAYQLKDYQDYIKKIDKQVIRDLQLRRSYYKGLQKEKLRKVQDAANNAYLKTNSIHQGINNYNQVVALVISWYHNSGRRK
jgi:hypothetical protein